MLMVDTMEMVVRPKQVKRRHSEEFKQAVVAACSEPGASVAGIALANGVNANLVRKWMSKRGAALPSLRAAPSTVPVLAHTPLAGNPPFIPVGIQAEHSGPLNIQIQIRRGNTSVSVSCPLEGAAACAAWLGEWLR